jgi:hypothetical protein
MNKQLDAHLQFSSLGILGAAQGLDYLGQPIQSIYKTETSHQKTPIYWFTLGPKTVHCRVYPLYFQKWCQK